MVRPLDNDVPHKRPTKPVASKKYKNLFLRFVFFLGLIFSSLAGVYLARGYLNREREIKSLRKEYTNILKRYENLDTKISGLEKLVSNYKQELSGLDYISRENKKLLEYHIKRLETLKSYIENFEKLNELNKEYENITKNFKNIERRIGELNSVIERYNKIIVGLKGKNTKEIERVLKEYEKNLENLKMELESLKRPIVFSTKIWADEEYMNLSQDWKHSVRDIIHYTNMNFQEFNIAFSISQISTFKSPNNACYDDLLNTFSASQEEFYIIFTGQKDCDGKAIGKGFVGAKGVVVKYNPNKLYEIKVLTHEIGHNFGAVHSEEKCSFMSPNLNPCEYYWDAQNRKRILEFKIKYLQDLK